MNKILLMFFSLIIASVSSFSSASVEASAGKTLIEVILNGKRIDFTDARPLTANGRVLVPLRVVSENLGAKVSYSNGVVTISQGEKTIKLTIGSKTAIVSGQTVALDSAPYVKSSRVFVPLRFVSEQLGQTVEWDGVDQYVWIGSKEAPYVQDVTGKAIPFKDMVGYFGKLAPYLFDDAAFRDGFRAVNANQLPIVMDNTSNPDRDKTIIRMWTETSTVKPYVGETMIKIHYYSKELSYFRISLLTGDGIPRVRDRVESMTEKLEDGSIIVTFPFLNKGDTLDGIKSWNDLSFEDIKYMFFFTDSSSYNLIKDPFK